MSKCRYDNSIKASILEQGLDKQVARVRKSYDNPLDWVLWCHYFGDETIGLDKIDCAIRLNESKYRRARRIRDKFTKMVESGNAIFVTLTFNDKTMAKTSLLTRRRYVSRYLKQNSNFYVANIDFGAKNEREHYHALVDKDLILNNWHKYGGIKVERVHNTKDDIMAVSKYVSKLTNHALKVEGIQPRLIYSRNVED